MIGERCIIVPNLGDSQTARSTLSAMMTPDELNAILERITQHQQTEQDLEMLRRSLRIADTLLQIDKHVLGDTHPYMGRNLDNLAMLHAAQGHDRVAEALYVEALEILEPGLGAEHPWTVRCRENLEQLRNRS
jgi:hypothetical protein